MIVYLQGLGNYRLEPNPHTVHLKLKTRQPQHSGFNSRCLFNTLLSLSMLSRIFQRPLESCFVIVSQGIKIPKENCN